MEKEMNVILENIKRCEDEAALLCDHQSWGAAEGATERKCYQIDRLMALVTPEQKSAIEQIMAKAFLAYLAKGPDYMGPYPSAVDAIKEVLLFTRAYWRDGAIRQEVKP